MRSPGRSLQCHEPPEQFAHPHHAGGSLRYGAQPPPAPPSLHVTGEVRALAGFRPRVISFLIDLVAPLTIVALLLVLGVAVGSAVLIVVCTAIGVLGLVAFVLWNSCYRQGVTGQSIGRRVAGTKLVKIETGAPVGFGTALVRQLCHGVEFGIGYLWPLWDLQRQTFADKITATLVVRVDR
ncbi:MAG: RDD family protein [Pseudonocardiaceae bacterium]